LSAAAVAQIRADPKLNPLMHFFSWFQTVWIGLNMWMPPLDDPKVRLALAKAYDRQTLCTNVLYGLGSPAGTLLMPGFPAYNPDLEAVQAFDVPAAQKLLADAGWPEGKKAGTKLKVTLWDAGVSAGLVFLKQQWETNLGIEVDLKENEGGVWGNNRKTHKMQLYQRGYEYDFVDPWDLLNLIFHSDPNSAAANNTPVEKWGAGYDAWYNKDFDDWLDKAGLETDAVKRLADFQEAEKILVTDVGGMFFTHQILFQIWWPWIVGIKPDKSGNLAWRFLDATMMQVYVHKDVDALKAQYKSVI